MWMWTCSSASQPQPWYQSNVNSSTLNKLNLSKPGQPAMISSWKHKWPLWPSREVSLLSLKASLHQAVLAWLIFWVGHPELFGWETCRFTILIQRNLTPILFFPNLPKVFILVWNQVVGQISGASGRCQNKAQRISILVGISKLRNTLGSIYFVPVIVCLRAVLDKAATNGPASWLKLFYYYY